MKRKLILIFLAPAILIVMALSFQIERDVNIVPGKLIVQLKGDVTAFAKHYIEEGVQIERCLSAELNIWLLSFDSEKRSTGEMLSLLRKDENISLVQAEHYISLRDKFPNDPSFAMQWALYNIGQTGGIEDADIDATLAWEINVNDGISALGDTIVIAVVDDGFYLAHEDMNYWKNSNEIPGNGLDDDSNGYIDDYDGWNAYTGTGEIISKSHGTRVAGIAGAVGNNQTGICGVGWNGKLLPVAGSSTFEATVVEAFSYVYKMRSLYDETNGDRGAYIVATNGSFGVDFANPDDYPIWHMMYDSLGSLGILSAAATMNHASDVDIVGDVPTSFDTDFMIGVTNTTKSDVKYNTAAWGAVSIDIGAPGANILSTATYNTYGYSTGTSMAAPQLSGSIGLLFACADSAFLKQYAESPAETAVFLKNIIMDGVDTLSGFDTLCVSGGRLNVNNAAQLLLNPRITIPETINYQLAPDSAGPLTVILSNLVGFDLPFECSVANTSGWLSCNQVSGIIPAKGNFELELNFDAIGLEEGTYYDHLVIEDAGGRKYIVNVDLEIIPGLGISFPAVSNNVFKCYPNPFTDKLMIDIKAIGGLDFDILIYSLSGELILGKTCKAGSTEIDTGGLPSGVYIVQLKGMRIFQQTKVIKL